MVRLPLACLWFTDAQPLLELRACCQQLYELNALKLGYVATSREQCVCGIQTLLAQILQLLCVALAAARLSVSRHRRRRRLPVRQRRAQPLVLVVVLERKLDRCVEWRADLVE